MDEYKRNWKLVDENTPVFVRQNKNMEWKLAYFAESSEGDVWVFENGKKSPETNKRICYPYVKPLSEIITNADKAEFIGQIIDMFEDFLTERNIFINNEDKKQSVKDGVNIEDIALIYGEDYMQLSDAITNILSGWNIINWQIEDKED